MLRHSIIRKVYSRPTFPRAQSQWANEICGKPITAWSKALEWRPKWDMARVQVGRRVVILVST